MFKQWRDQKDKKLELHMIHPCVIIREKNTTIKKVYIRTFMMDPLTLMLQNLSQKQRS
jgi:hypothetical protein